MADTLVEKLAPHIAAEVDRLLAEELEGFARYQEAGREVMHARDAADFLAISRASFNKLAPSLPRIRLSEKRYIYLRDDLLEWLRAKREAPQWWYRRERGR
jgi:hypothetical protein